MRVLITRPRPSCEQLAREIEASPGWSALLWPLTEIAPLHPAPPDLSDIAALAFTSANGARAYAAVTADRRAPAWCVGAATAEAAREAGFAIAATTAGGAAELAGAILADPPKGAVLHARGRRATGDLVAVLERGGAPARALEVYDAVETGDAPADVAAALAAGALDAALFLSPRAARIFARKSAGAALSGVEALAISPAAAAPLAPLGFARIFAPTAPRLADLLGELRQIESRREGELANVTVAGSPLTG